MILTNCLIASLWGSVVMGFHPRHAALNNAAGQQRFFCELLGDRDGILFEAIAKRSCYLFLLFG